jgi:hypothetical protein
LITFPDDLTFLFPSCTRAYAKSHLPSRVLLLSMTRSFARSHVRAELPWRPD